MKKYLTIISWVLITVFCSAWAYSSKDKLTENEAPITEGNIRFHDEEDPYRVDTENVMVNEKTTKIIFDERISNKHGIILKAGIAAAIDGERAEPDLIFDVKAPKAGRYIMHTFAVTDAEGAKKMENAVKSGSLYLRLQINDGRPTKRVVYMPRDKLRLRTGIFELSGKAEHVKIWLPRGVILGHIEFSPYVPPAVPANVQDYKPKIVPPSGHPRLWVNAQSLPVVKARLNVGENRAAWEKVKLSALTPFVFEFNADQEVLQNTKLEKAVEAKAFYYLMTGDKRVGREAVILMFDYLSRVQFDNLPGVYRDVGEAIYRGSEVYDWCYALLMSKEKQIFIDNFIRLAEELECGWPPSNATIVNGHGSEAQINRDLLSMSIAVYDEDPIPYQYTSYMILEQLVPMRKFEYQSPRHNQGVQYGAYRFEWDMHAAWLFYRMTGKPVFDDNIKGVRKFWQYMRLPDGQMLRDGDGFRAGQPGAFYYWKRPLSTFLNYTYAADPILKGEFERQGGLPDNPVLFLLLNDPALKAEPSQDALPLTMDFGPILGSMIARTGWNIGLNSNDVVAEIKGGGYHFGNHQHSDAGSMQLYYRGFQLGDIGLYSFYGDRFDMNFNKRSISHSMMLAVDPDETFRRAETNDGGTRFNRRSPKSPEEARTKPQYSTGKVLSADFGPSKLRPFFSYFGVDLTSAYSSKMKAYTRAFCFLNLDREDIPAAIILTDDMTTANPEFKKYWQINAHKLPEVTDRGLILHNERGGLVGKAHVDMLIPVTADREIKILSGPDAMSSFGVKYKVPYKALRGIDLPEANGHRIMISPKKASKRDRFLTVFQLTAGQTKPLPVSYYETPASYVVTLADRVVSMSNSTGLIEKKFTVKIPRKKDEYQVVLAGMGAGDWNVQSKDGKVKFNSKVADGKSTIFFRARGGEYIVTPGLAAGLEWLERHEDFMPEEN